MAVELLKTLSLTNADAVPVVIGNSRVLGGRVRQAVGNALADSVASIGSIYRLARVPSNACALTVVLSNAAFTTTGAADIGVYKSNAGAVVDADFFASAQLLTAALLNTEVTHESGVYTLANREKPLWEALGLTADPQIMYDVALTLTAANTTTSAQVALRVQYTQ